MSEQTKLADALDGLEKRWREMSKRKTYTSEEEYRNATYSECAHHLAATRETVEDAAHDAQPDEVARLKEEVERMRVALSWLEVRCWDRYPKFNQLVFTDYAIKDTLLDAVEYACELDRREAR